MGRRAAAIGIGSCLLGTLLASGCGKKEDGALEKEEAAAKQEIQGTLELLDKILADAKSAPPPKNKPGPIKGDTRGRILELNELECALKGELLPNDAHSLIKHVEKRSGIYDDWLSGVYRARHEIPEKDKKYHAKPSSEDITNLRAVGKLQRLIVVVPRSIREPKVTKTGFTGGEYRGDAFVYDVTTGDNQGGVSFVATSSERVEVKEYTDYHLMADLDLNARRAILAALEIKELR